MKQRISVFVILLLSMTWVQANNIQVTNVSVNGANISFNISWQNSWNATTNTDPNYPANWDAAWVFLKVQSNADNLWRHQLVSSTSGNHAITGGVLQVDAVTDGIGVFIRRTNPGSGDVSGTVTLQMQTLPPGTLNYKVFAVEMVYIPQGQFFLGDGGAAPKFTSTTITSETQSLAAGALFSGSVAVPATFPKGFAGFYAMKYEITMEQYADFLNTLTYFQQENFLDVAPNAATNTAIAGTSWAAVNGVLRIQTPGVNNTVPATIGCNANANGVFGEEADGQNIGCGLLIPRRFYAYLDWAGLRPMTEFEYEKICRGTRIDGTPNPRVANEFPWGTIDIAAYNSANMSTPLSSTESFVGTVINGRVLCNGTPNTTQRTVRVGSFATSGTGRSSAGAAFYGNMDMAGNCFETTIGVNTDGVTFTGALGDGNLIAINGPTAGDANVSGWPSATSATTFTQRGGSFNSTTTLLQTSARSPVTNPNATNVADWGGRGVRPFTP